jgi:hypothetical protein
MDPSLQLSQHIVYGEAYSFKAPTCYFLPKLKVGKFSQSPKIWFGNVKFLELSIFNLDGVIMEGFLKEKGALDPLGRTPKAQKKARENPGFDFDKESLSLAVKYSNGNNLSGCLLPTALRHVPNARALRRVIDHEF